ncbi:MAG TPA: methyltransferase domain-containing protein [Gaiellales bacterium]|nr:methyltransferase domain-containing protein [Gaiellales bacterium]
MEPDRVVREFTHQSESFNVAPVMRSADTLGRLVDLIPAAPGARWLDVACGPGLVARGLAPRVGEVHGVDMTPAMVEVARREAASEGIANAVFSVGDATALEFADAAFDGAVTRFSLHHIPVPGRVVAEMARVVRPGGAVVVADHVTSPDADEAAWHQEIERLRDPSHWACLTPARLRALGERAGLVLEREDETAISIDYDEWIGRGSGGPGSAGLIARALANRVPASDVFRVVDGDEGRRLELRYWLSVWRRP